LLISISRQNPTLHPCDCVLKAFGIGYFKINNTYNGSENCIV
jgi:hypothetical protein